MLLFKEISLKRFLLAVVIVIILTGLSYLSVMGNESGIISWLFYMLRFPTHSLFWDFFSQSSTLYRLGLVINIFFWSIILERVLMLVSYIRTVSKDL